MNITKAQLFIQAHIIAKTTRSLFPSYNGAFSFALITIYAEQRALTAINSIAQDQKDDAARAEAKMKADAMKVRVIAEENAAKEEHARLLEENKAIKAELAAVDAELAAIEAPKFKPVDVLVHWSESNAFGGQDEKMMSFVDFENIAANVANDNGDVKEFGYTKTKVTVYFDDAERSSYACRLDLAIGDEIGFQDHMEQLIKWFDTTEKRAHTVGYEDNAAFAKMIDYKQAA